MQPEQDRNATTTRTRQVLLATRKAQPIEIEGLNVLLEPLNVYFSQHIAHEEWQRFNFCLRQLLSSIDTLYLVLLPVLTGCTIPLVEHVPGSEHLRQRQQIWVSLRTITRLLEQTEPLCQLLNALTYGMLEALDDHTNLQSSEEQSAGGNKETRQLPPFQQEAWEQGYSALQERLDSWQQQQDTFRISTPQLADLAVDIPDLAHINSAFDLLLDQACSLFGEILPDFRFVTIDSNEGVAILLLDMMQKVDALLWQLDMLLEPLHSLMKAYAPGVRIH